MGKIARLKGRSLPWAREQFARYYARQKVPPPVRLPRREFAMFPFASETVMRRHAAFRTPEEFEEFLAPGGASPTCPTPRLTTGSRTI